MTEGQGHKVKGQGHIYVLGKIIVLAIDHEWINVSWWYLHILLILMRR